MNNISKRYTNKITIKTLLPVYILLGAFTLPVQAENNHLNADEFTNEQWHLLTLEPYQTYQQTTNLYQAYPIPLFSISISAFRQPTNRDQYAITTTYQSLGVNINKQQYFIEAPTYRGLDFNAAIRKRCQLSVQTFFSDIMTDDGSFALDYKW